jgi:hypothetical protein
MPQFIDHSAAAANCSSSDGKAMGLKGFLISPAAPSGAASKLDKVTVHSASGHRL